MFGISVSFMKLWCYCDFGETIVVRVLYHHGEFTEIMVVDRDFDKSTVILDMQVVFAKITVTDHDSAKLTVNPNMY
jgi:hypothetical protein